MQKSSAPNDYLERLSTSIELELAVAVLYEEVSHRYSNLKAFFWQLSLEERNHASLLKSLRDTFAPVAIVAPSLLYPATESLAETIAGIRNFTAKIAAENVPEREVLEFAHTLEQTAGEEHYQQYMSVAPQSPEHRMLQRLNHDDKDHASRIQKLLGP